MTTTAETAKLIRATLKTAYPAEIFSVKSRSFAGGDDINVDWTDGPTTEAVNALLKEYEGGTFDGMWDLYEYRNDNPKHPTVKYVMTSRRFSPEVLAAKRAELIKTYNLPTSANDESLGLLTVLDGNWNLGQAMMHELHQTYLTGGAK